MRGGVGLMRLDIFLFCRFTVGVLFLIKAMSENNKKLDVGFACTKEVYFVNGGVEEAEIGDPEVGCCKVRRWPEESGATIEEEVLGLRNKVAFIFRQVGGLDQKTIEQELVYLGSKDPIAKFCLGQSYLSRGEYFQGVCELLDAAAKIIRVLEIDESSDEMLFLSILDYLDVVLPAAVDKLKEAGPEVLYAFELGYSVDEFEQELRWRDISELDSRNNLKKVLEILKGKKIR